MPNDSSKNTPEQSSTDAKPIAQWQAFQENLNEPQNSEQDTKRAEWVDEPLQDKLVREAYLLTSGTMKGASRAADNMLDNPLEAAGKLALATAAGVGIAYLTRGKGLTAVLGWGTAAGVTAVGVKDSINYLKPAYEAGIDTFKSPLNFSQNLNKWEKSAGTFAFDTTVYGVAGGLGGSWAGRRFLPGKPVANVAAAEEATATSFLTREQPSILPAKVQPEIALAAIPEASLKTIATVADDLALKPLNVVSKGTEDIGRLMGNFAETPFLFNGRKYASVEGFYHSLKFADTAIQERVAGMHGPMAKSFGHKGSSTTGHFEGQLFELGSAQHHELVKQAIRAKLEQHPNIAAEFAATHPRPIVHDTGHKVPHKTNLPHEVFTRILAELREELIAKIGH